MSEIFGFANQEANLLIILVFVVAASIFVTFLFWFSLQSLVAFVRWVITFFRSRKRKLTKATGIVGNPGDILFGQKFDSRIVVGLFYNLSALSQSRTLERTIWHGDIKDRLVGLRQLMAQYGNRVPRYTSALLQEQIRLPFIHAAFVSSSGNVKYLALAAQNEFTDDFAAILPESSEPRFRHFGGAQSQELFVYFGHGVFIPPVGEKPAGELFLEEKIGDSQTKYHPITLGRTNDDSRDLAGLYCGQKALAFSNDNRITAASYNIAHATGVHTDTVFFLAFYSQFRRPVLVAYGKTRNGTNHNSNGLQQQPIVRSAVNLDNGLKPRTINPIPRDNPSKYTSDIRYDLTDYFSTPDKTCRVELVCIPDPTPERLQATTGKFVDDVDNTVIKYPYFEIEGLLLPYPYDWHDDAQACVLYLQEPGVPQGSVVVDPAIAVSLYSSDKIEVEKASGELHVSHRLELSPTMIRAAGIHIQLYPAADWANLPGQADDDENLPVLNRFVVVRRRESSSKFGYLLSLVDRLMASTGKPREKYAEVSPVVYNRFSTRHEIQNRKKMENNRLSEEFSLSWLDHAVSIKTHHNGVDEIVGYAEWCQTSLHAKDAAISEKQAFRSSTDGISIIDWYNGIEKETPLTDGTLFRLGPLIVRCRLPRDNEQ